MKKILIMDDEPNFAQPFLDKLEMRGVQYKYVQYFDELLRELQNGEYSCLSLDLLTNENEAIKYTDDKVMGINILRQIRESYPDLPIVCYTVLTDIGVVKSIRKYNGEYISKSDRNGFNKLFAFFNQYSNK